MFPEYTVTIIDKQTIAQDTIELWFTMPEGFVYKAGQYIGIDMPVGKTKSENLKSFSLSTPPYRKLLATTMRLTGSPYKKLIEKLKNGDKIKIQGPYGNFIIRDGDEDAKIRFFAQGIGITPFISIIRENTWYKKKQYMMLFYQNHSFETTAYLEELTLTQQQNSYFNFAPFIPLPAQVELMEKIAGKGLYFLCGSEFAVTAYKEILRLANVDKKQIRVEEFPGY